MSFKISDMEKELDELVKKGRHLYCAIVDEIKGMPEEMKKDLGSVELPDFSVEYDMWYSESLLIVKQLLPERLDDFIRQYKQEKRKTIDYKNYVISDYLNGITVKIHGKFSGFMAIRCMYNQYNILKSAKKCFKSSLCDIQGVLEADIFDSELASAEALLKKGFLRPAGVIAGVVLEKHLGHICNNHSIKIKKNPTIADCIDPLKNADVIDLPVWRKLQCLGDLRNLCSHNKDREPTKEEVSELITGVEKAIKTVW